MGATVIAYFPGMTQEQLDSQPGFRNDCRAWANWMAECEEQPQMIAAVENLNANAILTFKTDPMEDDEVEFVTPAQLREAATNLREAVSSGAPEAQVILKVYEKGANRINPVDEEFIRDLEDIVELANWGENEGATEITLEVNW